MTQIFLEPRDKREDGVLILKDEHFRHAVQVLRMRAGDEFSVYFKGDRAEYRYGIEKVGIDQALCHLHFVKESDVELSASVTVLQGIPKSDKMETVIQKTVELGVSNIVPVACARSVARLDQEKRVQTKRLRWNRIAEAAAEQSKRAVIPEVAEPAEFKRSLELVSGYDLKLMPYELEDAHTMERTRELLSGVGPGQRIAVLVGPEGGFDEREVLAAKEAGFETITLGRRILRTETAAMTVLSWLMLYLEP